MNDSSISKDKREGLRDECTLNKVLSLKKVCPIDERNSASETDQSKGSGESYFTAHGRLTVKGEMSAEMLAVNTALRGLA